MSFFSGKWLFIKVPVCPTDISCCKLPRKRGRKGQMGSNVSDWMRNSKEGEFSLATLTFGDSTCHIGYCTPSCEWRYLFSLSLSFLPVIFPILSFSSFPLLSQTNFGRLLSLSRLPGKKVHDFSLNFTIKFSTDLVTKNRENHIT